MKIFRQNFIQITTTTLLLLLFCCCQPGWSTKSNDKENDNGGAGGAAFVDLKQQQQQQQSLNKTINKTDNEKLIVPKNTTTTNIISQLIKSTASASSASTNAQRRSYEDDDYETQSLFKSLIPKSSTFKKPIKKIFRSWFEPDPEALDDESKKSSYYFARPKSNPLNVIPQRNNRNNPIQQDSSSSSINRQPIAHHPIGSNYGNRLAKYSNHDQQQQQYNNIASSPYTNKASSRQFSIGDPVNGRGLTLSFGDQSNEPSSASSYSQTVEQKPQYGYNSGNAGNPSPGLSLSFGGNGGGDSGGGGGGSGMSFNIGRGNGGDGRGMSLSLGRGNSGGSGLSFSFGGGGGGGSGNGYAQSGSASFPSYSSSYGGGNGGYNNYGVSYGNNYNNYDYNQPVFSMVMPSSGKQVIEYNQHPSKMKMKINSSPRVKITTNTKDPLDKPGLEDEIIQEDIFGPPEPFDKPNRTSTSSMNETMPNGIHNMTMMMGHFNQSMYPYSPYSPYQHYYQYPYNYYYHNYYQQHYPSQYYQYMMNVSSMYPNMMMMPPMAVPPMSPMPQQQQPPQMKPPPMQQQQQQQQYRPNYSQYAASTMNMPTKTNTIQPSLMPMTYNMPVSTSYSMLPSTATANANANTLQTQSQLSSIYGLNTGQIKTTYPPTSMVQQPSSSGSGLYTQTSWQPYGQQQQQMINGYQQQQPKSLMIDNNNHGYKRSSASRNYQKDMLTLNSLQGTMRKSSYNQRKSLQQPLHSMKRNSNKYYTYDLMQTSESQLNPQQQQQQYPGYNLTTLALMNDATRNYYYQPMASSQQAMPGSQQPMPGTGAGYSFFNNTMMGQQHYNGSSYWNPYNYYYSPYYYNYYNNYYNYAKKYYETYYANQLQQQNNKTSSSTTSKYYPRKNITSITGFSQNSFDYEQSKRFGHRAIKYQGGSTKEEKARVILDIRPRVTIKMLNKTEQAMQDEELKKKKKDHIFKTHMEIIMETTTTPKPYYYNNYDSYYGYNYGPEVDDFGWTHEPPYGSTETTTMKPRTTTTTRRRTTTTESSSSSEVSEEENGTSESTSGESSTEEDDQSSSSSSTTTEASDTESVSEEVEEESDSAEQQQSSSSSTTTTTTESSVSEEGDGGGGDEEVIDANEDDDDNNKSSDNNDEDQDEDNRKSDDQDETAEGGGEEENGGEEEGEEEQKIIDSNQLVGNNNVTVSPELVQAMIKALQEALGVTTTTTMTPIDDLDGFNEETTGNNEDDNNNQIDEQSEHEENDMITTTTMKPSILKPKNGIKGIIETGRRRLPTNVITTTVRNVTQVRLKTPVLSMRSGKTTTTPSQRRFFTTPRPIFGSNSNDNDNDDGDNLESGIKNIKNLIDLTTTSPLLIVNKLQPTQLNTPKIIDGDALLNNFDINNLTDDERRQMLTNILGVIQNRAPTTLPTTTANNIFDTRIIRSSTSKSKQTKTSTKRSSSKQKSTTSTTTPKSTRLLPVTKANNVRIISSLDELNKETNIGVGGGGVNGSGDKSTNQQQPIYVVLLPQNKKKK
ncbi:uncharacterized protein LOC113789155 [Dermatophagoides pteronyssinus]|uniref:uncharacterized protein LOC113789155 n=1 Tax=Dermatophagoides pteronyssinus TaxID=6956 RepID=UPI003F66CB0B